MFAQESVMGIKKEREAFERLPLAELAIESEFVFYNEETNSYWPNEDFCPSDAPEAMNFAWEAWRAAKAQAVPEGFVLVPKKPDVDKAWNVALKRIVPPPKINDVVQKELMCKKYVDDLCFEQDRILLNYEEMIEAQEQSHD